ncbi:MAG: helix-turn-helix domain-containing protein [Pseudonocardiaceae bacterium]
MTSTFDTPGPGRNVAILRKQHDMTQAKLAREAGVSVSLLSKIEVGDRALSQGVAAALARAMGITLDEALGKVRAPPNDETKLKDLRATIRRFDLPGEPPDDPTVVNDELANVIDLRSNADISGLLEKLPALLSKATNHAHAVGLPAAWAVVADTYSAVYWLAARNRWMDLAELAVMKQQLAAQRATPLVGVTAARDEAGSFLNSGDFEGGLIVVDRAIVQAESTLEGRDRALGLGLLHLRGLTLAGRLGDKAEADRHTAAARRVADEFPEDINVHGIGFGPQETVNHIVATSVDLDNPAKALEAADHLNRQTLTLRATGVVRFHMNLGRAKLALGDRDGALGSLVDAWNTAPQVARVHPASQELLRVLISLHKRSNPTLTKLAKKAKVNI